MSELVNLFVRALEHAIGEAVEKGESSVLGRIALSFLSQKLPELLKRVANPQVLVVFLFAVAVAMLFIAISMAADVAMGRRCGRVFISFQHDREAIADNLGRRLEAFKITPRRLPFVENPDHDTLLDEIREAIHDCDVFVCVPGRNPSFVESEVSMAFGLEKPLLFIVDEESPRLPNTAKKGYPIFALQRLESDDFQTLASFCSYLSGDWRSTARLYGAICGLSFKAFSFAAIFAYLVSILATMRIMGPSALTRTIPVNGSLVRWAAAVVRDPHSLCFFLVCLVALLVPYAFVTISRMRLRTRVRRAIGRKKFSETLLLSHFSLALDYSLAGEDVCKFLCVGEARAAHEAARAEVESTD